MDERSMGAARRLVRYTSLSRALDVPQLLSVGREVAVHGHSVGGERMSDPLQSPAHSRHAASAPADILPDVLAGLRGTPKTLPAKLFYDARGAKLFEQICTLDE